LIAPEGKIILIPLLILVILGTGIQAFYPTMGLKWMNLFLACITVFSLYFFRDPQRIPPNADGFLAPADGKIVQIREIEDDELGKAWQISIFLSVWNVHSQRVPLSGKVLSKKYIPGKFFAAFKHKASKDNEQTSVLFEGEKGNKFKIKQIAGWIARRIINYMEPKKNVERGERLGFIRFGSRVDIIVPEKFQLDVSLGDIVTGNQTIIGRFK
jgi:phosphatidylserine decarboxylase